MQESSRAGSNDPSAPPSTSTSPAAPTQPKKASSSNIPPRLDTPGVSKPKDDQAPRPPVTPIGGPNSQYGYGAGAGPIIPGSRGRVDSGSTVPDTSPISDPSPAPRIAQVLGYAGETIIFSLPCLHLGPSTQCAIGSIHNCLSSCSLQSKGCGRLTTADGDTLPSLDGIARHLLMVIAVW